MKHMPFWITEILKKKEISCYSCDNPFHVNSVVGVGVKKSIKNSKKDAVFVDLRCLNCNKTATFEIANHNLLDLAYDILDEIEREAVGEENIPEQDKCSQHRHVSKRTKITKKEMNEMSQFLKNVKTHEDFLTEIGMSPEEIEFYSFKKGKKHGK